MTSPSKPADTIATPTSHLTALDKTADEVEQARDALNAALERRDARVVNAVDDGLNPGTVATHARISRTRVLQLVEASYSG